MSYDPYEWADGPSGETPITAERLNAIELGLEAASDAVDLTADVTGALPPANGGTGLSTFTAFRFLTTSDDGTIRAEKSRPVGAVVGTSDTQGLTNKDLSSATNTFPSTLATTAALAAAITANGPGVVAVLGPADPIPGGTPPGLIVRLAE